MATTPSIMKAPVTKAQGWTNQFNYLQSQRENYQAIIDSLTNTSQTQRLQDAQRGLLTIEYNINQFLNGYNTLLSEADKLQADLANNTFLTPDQRLSIQHDIDIKRTDAINFNSLMVQQNWLSNSPPPRDIPIGNQIFNNVGNPPTWDKTTLGGALMTMIGSMASAFETGKNNFNTNAQYLGEVFRPFIGGATAQESYDFCTLFINELVTQRSGKIFNAPNIPGASPGAQFTADQLIGAIQGNTIQLSFSPGGTTCQFIIPKDDFINIFKSSGLGGLSEINHGFLPSSFTIELPASGVKDALASNATSFWLADGLSKSPNQAASLVASLDSQYQNFQTMTDISTSFNDLSYGVIPSNSPTTSTVTTTTTTTAPSITQTGTANEGAAAAAVANGIAIGNGVKTVSFSNGELNSTGTYASIIAAMTTSGIRPGNFSVLPDGSVAPVGSHLISNPAQSTTITVPNLTGGSNYTVNNYGVVIPNILNSNRTYVDPLILDLNNDGVQLTSYADRTVLFDIDHDGLTAGQTTLEQTGWVKANTSTGQTHSTDGIVVHDLNGNGKIDGIHETLSEFYNGAAGTEGNAGEKKYSNGFTALKSLDTGSGVVGSAGYNDNVFDNKDAAYNQLRVWVDANADGITDAGELKTLAELNITSINLTATTQSGLVNGGNEILATGTFTQNGQTKQAQAVNFVANTAGSSFTATTEGVRIDTQAGETGQTTSTYTHTGSNNATLSTTALNVKNIYGNTGNDTITGDANANWLGGGAGADSINAGAGDDVILFDADDTSIDGGDGNDIAQVIGESGVTLNLAQSHIEAVVGGRGDDIFIGGGRSSVFITANDGNDIVIGGAANDVLSGENGEDLIDGGTGNDLMRGGRGNDQLIGGSGDDIIEGGQDDDNLNGGDGNDVLTGGQGDDQLDGGLGNDLAEFSGSYADYRVTKVTSNTYRVTDLLGRDGTDTLTNIEKLSFKDISWTDPDLAPPMPVKDILDVNSTNAAFNRTAVQLINKAQLLGNDIDRQNDVLHITALSDVQGGTAIITTAGDVQFTPDANYKGIMGFKYSVADADSNVTQVTDASTGQTATMKAAVYLRTPDVPTDPLIVEQWYLSEANIIPVWEDYTGKGIKIAQFEPGGEFSVGPEVMDITHPDLKPNLDDSWLANTSSNIPQTYSNHATMVAGVIVGVRNGEGGVGVAYDAKISGHYIQGSGLTITALEQEITNALATFKNYDVVNNSWGASSNFDINVVPVGLLQTGIADAVDNGRDGLGTIIVMAGGNDRQTGGNTNTSALTGNRAVIVAGGINAVSDLGNLQIGGAPFSNPGASILVSAPASNIASSSRLIEADNGSTFGADYSATQGTSFATPIISGIVALILEANPNLGWRDVQQILAITAKKVNDANTNTVYNTANNWNGGGMHTSHDYGFGEVDARAAVRLAETWTGSHTSLNERHLVSGEGSMNGAANLNIAINDGASITRTLAIGAGVRAEHVTVSLDVNHSNWGDLTVELISPTGTKSILLANTGTYAANSGGEVGDGRLTFALDTTHSYGENAQGNWQLKITDRTGRGAGTLYGWKVDVYGSDLSETIDKNGNVIGYGQIPIVSSVADNSYYFTDEFASVPIATHANFNDTNGGIDAINASAVSKSVTINLNNATSSNIDGRIFSLNGTIENVFGGDGNDTIAGNTSANRLVGGRGNDNLNGGNGIDILEGGKGNDNYTGGSDRDYFVISKQPGATDTIEDFNVFQRGEKILLTQFTNLSDFSQITKSQEGLNLRIGLGDGQSIVLNNVNASDFSETAVVFDTLNSQYPWYVYKNTFIDQKLPYLFGESGFDYVVPDNGQLLVFGSSWADDALFGTEGQESLFGEDGNDLLDGGAGDDTLWGGAENGEVAPYSEDSDWLRGGAGDDILYGGADYDFLFGGSGDDTLDGGDSSDYLDGGSGQDLLLGGSGEDFIIMDGDRGLFNLDTYELVYGVDGGGGFSNVYFITNTSNASEDATSWTDETGSYFQAVNLISGFGYTDGGYNIIDVSTVASVNGFSDIHVFNEIEPISSIAYTKVVLGSLPNAPVVHLLGALQQELTEYNFNFKGQSLATITAITGDAGGNTLHGSLAADSMTGRTGDDTFIVDNEEDTVIELAGGGYDAVQSSATYTLAENVEQLTLTGTAAISGTGNNDANRIVGNSGSNILDGKAGSDDLRGGIGNDTYIVGTGADRVTENANEGTDTVQSSVSWTLGKNVENLTLTGLDSINATGNEQANTLIGNAADNILDGAQGADSMQGGAGNDTYYVDNAGDLITEVAGGGYDTVYSSVNISTLNTTSAAQVEQLILAIGATQGTGNALDNMLIGNDVNNTLTGLAGADYLDGGAGVDTLVGGAGDDTYVIDVIKSGTVAMLQDTVTEIANEGIDTLQLRTNSDLALSAATTLTLAINLENLHISATGSNKLDITGNGAANRLTGNAANNILTGLAGNDYLDGGLGADSMSGGTEDDTYFVDNIGDVVAEAASQGNDTVISSIAFNLTTAGANVENLTLTGLDSINATGNGLVNTLIGNAGNNVLDGAAGNDQLQGGAGDDTYLIDSGDVIMEFVNQGVDTVKAGFTYTLGNNLENLTVTGTGLFDLTGNSQNNTLTGNSSANSLNGGLGNDTLIGGAGNDTYIVGHFVGYAYDTWQAAGGQFLTYEDVIYEDDGGAGNIDTIRLNVSSGYPDSIDVMRESFRQNDDLILVSSTANQNYWDEQGNYDSIFERVRIKNYYLGTQFQVEKIQFNDDVTVNTVDLAYSHYGSVENDYLTILAGERMTDALAGDDIVIGNASNNIVYGGEDNDYINGGLGADKLRGDSGNDLIIGNVGNDTITTGTGYDVISFNKGDGQDIIYDSTGADNALSLGGNFAYSDLSLTKTNNNLILKVGSSDQITFANWYSFDFPSNSVVNLQVIAEAMQGFSLGNTDNLRNNKVESFNFANLVTQFDTEGATTNWQLTDARLTAHLQAGSDTAAIGGDLAYQYGRNSNLTGMGLANAQSVIASASFGQTAQTLNNPSVWQAEVVKLG